MAISTSIPLTVATRTEKITVKKLLWAAPLLGVIAAALNAIVYFLYTGVGFNIILPLPNPTDPTQLTTPLLLAFVVPFSFVPALIAAGLLWALVKLTHRPLTLFTSISVIALILSFGASLPLDMPIAFKLGLDVMHIVAGIVIIGGLRRLVQDIN